MIRNDIVGLTLAEIALVLLFAFLVLLFPSYARLNGELKIYRASNPKVLQEQLAQANAENERLKLEAQRIQSEEARTHRHLRSELIPPCSEVNGADWLFTAVIVGPGAYEVSGHQYTLDGLRQKYSQALSDAQADGCKQRVKVYYRKGISADSYYSGLERIERFFYDKKLGAEP